MKRLFLLLNVVCGLVCTGMAQTPPDPGVHTPGPTYPDDARTSSITGSGTCQVVFDASGHIHKAVMTKSTGSQILDENTLSFARKNWTGHPNTKISVSITYKLKLPPTAAASGICQVGFDGSGHVTKAVMTKSMGSKILDDNTVDYVRKSWVGKPNSTLEVPLTYQMASTVEGMKDAIIVNTPYPAYPDRAKASHVQGTCIVKVKFDENGHPISAMITRSTGNGILDANTIDFVMTNWKSSGGEKTTISVPITYRLR